MPNPNRLDATALARVAVFVAIVAVLSLTPGFSVIGVPLTAQTFGVMLAGAVLGPWLGALAMIVYLALIAVGLPIASGGTGGIGLFVGPTAGFLYGFVLGAFVVGAIVHLGNRVPQWWRTALAMIVGGIVAVYLIGVPVLSLVTKLSLSAATSSMAVFVPGDLIKAVLATLVVTTLVRVYPRAFRREWVNQ